VNATAARQIVANAAVAPLSDRGASVFVHPGGHVAIDVAGVFTGAPIPLAPAADEEIGRSLGGRAIVATHRLDHPGAPRKVLVLGFMHGEEQAGLEVVRALRSGPVPDGVDLWLVETMNPDGGAARRRGNARGVDLNRNFDGGSSPWCASPGCGAGALPADTGSGPMSEPETQVFWAFLQRERFDLIVSYHQPLDTVDCSPQRGATLLAICGAYAAASGIPLNRTGYIDLSGTMTNSYMQANPGRWAFTMEFPPSGAGDVTRHVAAVWAAVERV
jgi:protein MpaA